MSDYFLYLDFETTGLDPDSLTVLEVSWTVTDSHLRQLTPLRKRLVQVSTGGPVVFATESGWSDPGVSSVVREMHQKSGLHADLLAAHPSAVLRRVEELDRLIIDDLISARWTTDDVVYLTGSGVSHFDRQVLESMGSRLTSFQHDSKGKPVLHYRAADVSSAIAVLGIRPPKTVDDLSAFLASAAARDGRSSTLVEFQKLITDESTESLTTWGEKVTDQVNMSCFSQHRGASDVAWALLLTRALRAFVGVLDPALT